MVAATIYRVTSIVGDDALEFGIGSEATVAVAPAERN
jgi:hypothetical protein